MKYHISPSTGNPNKCYARTKPCPVGGVSEHYPSKEAAREAYESKHKGYTFTKASAQPKLSEEDVARVEKSLEQSKKYGVLKDEETARLSRSASIGAARHLEAQWGRKLQFLNESAYQRLAIPDGMGAEVELQGANGKVYFRVLDSAHRTGYDPHDKASWSVSATGNAGSTIQKTVEKYMSDYKAEREAGYARAMEADAKRKSEAAAREEAAKAQVAAERRARVAALNGPKPSSIKMKYPASTRPSYKCTHCGTVEAAMMQESRAEGFDGYSPCCNEPITSATEKVPPSYETTFSSHQDVNEFTRANGIRNFMVSGSGGKYILLSSLPGFND